MLTESEFPEARCLDGSMYGYYLRKGSPDHFLLFFQGGGWCYDQDCASPTPEGTLRDCHSRSKSHLGSSTSWYPTEDSYLTGSLSADPAQNPVFHNWTMVYLPYCDGTSWSGDAVVNGLHFKGRAIRDAVVAHLKATAGVQRAKKVVISGGSAGASAVYFHADTIAAALQLTVADAEVLALPDAGFFLDLPDKDGMDCWPNQVRSIWNVSNGYRALHSGCLARFPQDPWRCLFPQYYGDLIKTRLFAVNALYDSSELSATLRLGCATDCRGRELKLFRRLRDQHMQAWRPLVARPGNGVWAVACVAHTTTWKSWVDARWEVPANSGETEAAAVQEWLMGPHGNFVHEDSVAWPHNGPCSGKWQEALLA